MAGEHEGFAVRALVDETETEQRSPFDVERFVALPVAKRVELNCRIGTRRGIAEIDDAPVHRRGVSIETLNRSLADGEAEAQSRKARIGAAPSEFHQVWPDRRAIEVHRLHDVG